MKKVLFAVIALVVIGVNANAKDLVGNVLDGNVFVSSSTSAHLAAGASVYFEIDLATATKSVVAYFEIDITTGVAEFNVSVDPSRASSGTITAPICLNQAQIKSPIGYVRIGGNIANSGTNIGKYYVNGNVENSIAVPYVFVSGGYYVVSLTNRSDAGYAQLRMYWMNK